VGSDQAKRRVQKPGTRRGLRRGGALALALLVSGLTAAGTSANPPALGALRVCGHDRVPFTGSQCSRDQSRQAIVAKELDCSVHVSVRRPETLRAEFRYQGMLQFTYVAHVTPRAHSRVIGTYFYDTKMPAGRYACRFTLGRQRLGTSFHSGGPTGNLLGPSVCLAAHHVGVNECPQDEGGAPLPSTGRITCDAVFARERGATATIELLGAAGNVVDTQTDTLSYPITEAGATFASPGGTFSPGSYDCRLSVAGQHIDRQFSVSG
jgi:hypothetical protein